MQRSLTLVPVAVLAMACSSGPNLPEGWEEAELVNDFQQSECTGEPGTGATEEINGVADATTMELSWTNTEFRCEQKVEAYLKRLGVTHELLVQPVEMEPDEVANCDCLYDLDAQWNISGDLESVRIFKRVDEFGGPSAPAQIAQLNLSGG